MRVIPEGPSCCEKNQEALQDQALPAEDQDPSEGLQERKKGGFVEAETNYALLQHSVVENLVG